MPIFQLTCEKCGKQVQRLLAEPKGAMCPCGGRQLRTGKGPSSRIVEVRDNGFMPRPVEQLANIQELVAERSKSTKPK